MKITTKYDLKDFVYPIRQGGYDVFVNCETCSGKGEVSINNTDKTITCPSCYGRKGSREWFADKWFVDTEHYGQIGKIDVYLYAEECEKNSEYRYMLDSTGIGTGTIWPEDKLFIDLEEAKQVCDEKNLLNTHN